MNKCEIFERTLEGISIQELVNYLTSIINNPIVIISKNFNIISYSNQILVKDKTWQAAIKRGFITLEFGFNLSNWDKYIKPNQNYLEFNHISNKKRRFYKLEYRNQLLGYLNILESNQNINSIKENDYEFIISLISKELFFSTKEINFKQKYTNRDIMFSLHNQEFKSEYHFLQRVDNLTLNNYRTFQLIIVDIKNYFSYNAATDDLKAEISTIFNKCVIITELNFLYILLYDHTLVVNEHLIKFLKTKNLQLNVSSIFYKLYQYKIYENEAMDALNLKSYLDEQKLITYFDDVKIFKILTTYTFKRDYIHYLDNKVVALINYDQVHHSDLLNTVYNYLKYEKSVKTVASKLYIHRNTVNYRIKQVKDIFKIDFDNFNALIKIYISIELYYMHNKKLEN